LPNTIKILKGSEETFGTLQTSADYHTNMQVGGQQHCLLLKSFSSILLNNSQKFTLSMALLKSIQQAKRGYHVVDDNQ